MDGLPNLDDLPQMNEIDYLKELAQSYGLNPGEPTPTVTIDLEEPQEPTEEESDDHASDEHDISDSDEQFGIPGKAPTTITLHDQSKPTHGPEEPTDPTEEESDDHDASDEHDISDDPDDQFGIPGKAQTTITLHDQRESGAEPTKRMFDEYEDPYAMEEEPADTTQTIEAIHTLNVDIPDLPDLPDAAGHGVSLMKFGWVLVAALIGLAV